MRAPSQHHKFRWAAAWASMVEQGEFDTKHRGQAMGPCRFGEPHDAVETVAVGDGYGLQAQSDGFLHQFFGV